MVFAGDIYMVSSRFMLRIFGLALIALTLGMAANADSLTVKTDDGKLQGKHINDGKVRAYQGIPYAAPPVGDLRWKAPQPAAKWKGKLDATKYGHHCWQTSSFPDMSFQDAATADDPGSEDCLYLNIYAPASAKSNAKLPVMFWIHGGGYSGGSASEPRHNGDFLPLKGVILVTINYRLGVFGFMALPELATEQGGSSGNYGMMDMVSALQWVKQKHLGFRRRSRQRHHLRRVCRFVRGKHFDGRALGGWSFPYGDRRKRRSANPRWPGRQFAGRSRRKK